MARPIKQGLDYFSFDVDFFADEKISAIRGEFGIKGEIVVIKLLCAIYRNGYFAQWSDVFKYGLLNQLPSISEGLFCNIVRRLVEWGFFEKALFNSAKILTSKGIQRRYFEVYRNRLRKRQQEGEELQYWLLNDDDESYGGVSARHNPAETELFPAITPQSKGKERKVNTKVLSLNCNTSIIGAEQKICSTPADSQNEEKDLFGDEVPKEMKPEVKLTEFKIILNDGSYYTVIADELENWQKLYPAVDVPQELRNMQGWSDANPRKRKTKTGIKRFINKWLADEQNKGGSGRFQVPPKRFEPLPTSKRPIGKPKTDDCPF